MVELATMVIDLTARTRALFTGPGRRTSHANAAPISRAQGLLDWKPRTMLKDGPVRTITYFDELLSDQKLRARLITEPSA